MDAERIMVQEITAWAAEVLWVQLLEHDLPFAQVVQRNRPLPKQELVQRVQHNRIQRLDRQQPHDKEALPLRDQEQPQLEAEVQVLPLEGLARPQEVAPEVQAVDDEISRITLKKIQWKK